MAITFKEHITFAIRDNRLDAKYFRPDYLSIEENIRNNFKYTELGELIIDIVHPREIPRDYTTSEDTGNLFLLVKNLDELFINLETEKRFAKENILDTLQVNRLEIGDLLLTRTGDVKNLSVFYDIGYENTYASADILIIKFKDRDMSYYTATFLKTEQGRKLLERRIYGAVQPKTSPYFVKTIPVPILEDVKDTIIGNYKKAINLINESSRLYEEAEDIFYAELGISIKDIEPAKKYKKHLKYLIEKNRFDPMPFNPTYDGILNKITDFDYLYELVDKVNKGIEVGSENYLENGDYLFLRVANLTKWGINTNKDTKYINEELFKAYQSFKPDKGEILFAKDGTIGTAYKVREDDINYIVSNGILRINAKEEKINSTYLEFVLNSFVGKLQSEINTRGSNIPHLYQVDFLKFKIPRLQENAETTIVNKIEKAIEKRKEALNLLKSNIRFIEEKLMQR